MAGSAWRQFLTPHFGTRRLALAAIIGVAVGFGSSGLMRLPFRIAAGWIVAVAIHLALSVLILGSAGPEECRHNARREDPRRAIIFGLLVTAAAVSLLALGYSFGKVPGETSAGLALRLLFGALTILASWTLTHTIFGCITRTIITAMTKLSKANRIAAACSSPGPICPTIGILFISPLSSA